MIDEEPSRTPSRTPPHRPNANYRLSKPDGAGEGEPLNFHYSREHRLAKAPQAVKDLYAEQPKHSRFNLLRPLVSTKPKAMLFFSIITICAVVYVLSLMGYFDNSHLLEGNKIIIRAAAYEGATVIVVRKILKKGSKGYGGAVDIAVSPVVKAEDEEFPVFYHRVFFTMETEEEYRFAVPFDSPELALVLQTERAELRVKIKPE
ncbi:MAG: hypothetical protein LBG91_03485 [Treponema sp.]|nr:hypothetical protein [Treponema sp.]